MQPRLTGGGAGKSNDDIVYELAGDIMAQLMDKLDIDEAKPEMFEVDLNVHVFIRWLYGIDTIHSSIN